MRTISRTGLRLRGVAALFGVTAVALTIAGCATKYPPAPVDAATADYNYHIGPLDSVNVIVWRNPRAFDERPGAAGRQDHDAAGRRPAGAGQDADRARARHGKGARQIHPRSGRHRRRHELRRSDEQQIRVIGEAAKPQILPYRKQMTLLDVMIAVGGLTDFADGNEASIFRVAEGGKQYSVRLQDLVKRGDITANVDMRPATSSSFRRAGSNRTRDSLVHASILYGSTPMNELYQQVLDYLRGMWHRRWIGLGRGLGRRDHRRGIVYRIPEQYEASARVYVDTESLLRPLARGPCHSAQPRSAGGADEPHADQPAECRKADTHGRPGPERQVDAVRART